MILAIGALAMSDLGPSALPPAAWYEDPHDATRLRYWDGSTWTHHVHTPGADDLALPGNQSSVALGEEMPTRKQRRQVAGAESRRLKEERRTAYEQSVEAELAAATLAAQSGDILKEERHIKAAGIAMVSWEGRSGLKRFQESVASMEFNNKLRIGSRVLGTVQAENAFTQYARKESITAVKTGKSADVRSDRIFYGDQVHVIDAYTSAQVVLDGQVLISHRPTLTRMALMSPLPGSALVPGLALQKKKQHDQRHAEFIVVSPDWSISVPVSPDNLTVPRQVAAQINRIADTLANDSSPAPTQRADIVGELERIQQLVEKGLLTTEEAQALKASTLSGPPASISDTTEPGRKRKRIINE